MNDLPKLFLSINENENELAVKMLNNKGIFPNVIPTNDYHVSISYKGSSSQGLQGVESYSCII